MRGIQIRQTILPVLSSVLISGFLLGTVGLGAFAQPPEAIRNYNQGIEAYTQGRPNEALKRFTRAVQADPGYADAYYNMGSIYYQMKRYDDARAMFQKAADLSPNDSQAKYNLALTLEKMLRYEEAVRVLSQIPPTDPKAAQAKIKMDELLPATQPKQVAQTPAAPAVSRHASKTPSAQPLSPHAKAILQTFSKGYDGPTGLSIGPGGFMYVANYSKNLIYRVGANGEKTVFAQGDNLKGPIGLVFNPKTNELYVANYLLDNVVRINAAGKASVLMSGVNKPYNLFLDTVNNVLYVSEQENNLVSRIILPQ